ncbi:hypothetical protein NUU61_006046 [Penicillium alfredii]|uniref:PI-PLC Y-box domain-containing protein n=1 Tax=Penicillium alfredii TaxID=1506179 RepID=A0A9W9F0D5_9EURO|nr:uncharacterized protein NUU61_006046 [Penicillium alfredii]KAJ5091176.1 hypothetical protein NUU61_006046 [Penicillium alfredii]
MPSPATPHRPSNRGESAKPTPTKPLDIGEPLGIHDTNTVRSRVRKWQQHGGGVITIDDPYADDGDENNAKTKPKPGKIRLDRIDKTDRADRTDKDGSTVSTVLTVPTRKRSHSTPRKRVISDEHWKKNRNRSSTQTASRNLPAPNRISEYTVNDTTGSPRAKRDDKHDDREKGRESLRHGANRGLGAGSRSPVREWKPRRNGESIPPRPKSMAALSEVSEKLRSNSPPPEDIEWAPSEADFSELSKRRARGRPKAPKGGIFSHMFDESKKMFAKPEHEPPKSNPPGNRGAKIEAWLSGTPDPFLDEEDSKSDMPAPLDTKAARARRSQRLADGDLDRASELEKSQDGESRPKSSHSRHSKERDGPSPKHHKAQERDATSEPKRASTDRGHQPPLKPRDAKPVRDKPHEERLALSDSDMHSELNSEIQPPSEGSEVSGHNAPVPLSRKRPFPSTGYHRLSTIASAETISTSTERPAPVPQKTASTTLTEEAEEAEKEDHFDPDSLPAVSSQLKRRLTTHNDLMSVLSVPASRSRSIRSGRSIRSNKSRLAHATVADLLQEFSADEAKYMRELKTLVGGVIPVLLTCVLSRSDSAIAAGLFRPSLDPKDDMNFSKPIVNMGVAVERLKTLHKRIPQDNPDALLNWAQGAQRVYREYLKAWRLGFKDVVVNLAPLEEGDDGNNADTKSLDEGMERDENGDVIDSEGEKVDVAYLLKRPLVRLKYLAKSFKGINTLQPSSKAEEIATAYQSLVIDARKRARDERARLEDESAASIDATRVRDPMTLGVLRGVTVDQSRRVRARDFFNLSLYHSSGQLVDCRAELLYRDNTPSKGMGGDLLICEIDHSDRWLLFPPMDLRCVSARTGDSKGEIVVMLRSAPGQQTKYWQELISLRIDEEDIGAEWIQLLGSDPIPPSICRSQSFISRAKQHKARRPAPNESPPRPNPSDVDIPIGEKATSKRRSLTPKEQFSDPSTVSSSAAETRSSVYSTVTRDTDYTTGGSELSIKPSRPDLPLLPSTVTTEKSAPGLKRSKAKRQSRYGDSPAASETTTPKTVVSDKAAEPPSSRGRFYGEDKDLAKDTASPMEKPLQKSPQKTAQRTPQKSPVKDLSERESPRLSSVPSATLPLIPKIRSASSQTHLSTPNTEPEEEDYPPLESLPDQDIPETPTRAKRSKSRGQSNHEDTPPPPPPPHRSPSPASKKLSNTPVLSPSGAPLKRRGSSPLKHEYEPSTASDSYSDSDSDASTVRHYAYSSSEYSRSLSDSDEYSSTSEDDYEPPPKLREYDTVTSETSSLSPSNSASQSGYRAVPLQPAKFSKAIASVFAWSEKGTWDSVLPDECNIIVSPGLIEAFKGIDPNNTPERADKASRSSRPLISLELTPLVPIRRGTAIDISIRSPPTERSKITSRSNIMFRSRNPDECDALYGLINQARINNPTYIALQNARGPINDPIQSFEPATKAGGGLFGWPRRRKSYRASGAPRSLAEGSDSSVGTMSSAFSALKRFGASSRMFNIARSTVTSRNGGEDSLYSGSADSGTHTSPTSGIGRIAAAIKGADGIGLSNAKIRLYVRESASKWRDMGAARLTIMPAPPKNPPSRPGTAVSGRSDSSSTPHPDSFDGTSSPPASGTASPRREVEPEKRIIVRGKTRGEVLLDVCLGESSFERVARTGIAVSVWEESGAIAKEGGVTSSSQRIYMVQMKSEAEAAYTFGLVGKLRY